MVVGRPGGGKAPTDPLLADGGSAPGGAGPPLGVVIEGRGCELARCGCAFAPVSLEGELPLCAGGCEGRDGAKREELRR